MTALVIILVTIAFGLAVASFYAAAFSRPTLGDRLTGLDLGYYSVMITDGRGSVLEHVGSYHTLEEARAAWDARGCAGYSGARIQGDNLEDYTPTGA
jgi:hypothetical protein